MSPSQPQLNPSSVSRSLPIRELEAMLPAEPGVVVELMVPVDPVLPVEPVELGDAVEPPEPMLPVELVVAVEPVPLVPDPCASAGNARVEARAMAHAAAQGESSFERMMNPCR
jgi:hypothetical protein